MHVISNHFDLVHFTECEFEKPVIFGEKIMIPTHNIGLLPSHPLNQSSEVIFLQSCCLIFEGVKKSVRHLTGYVEETPGSNKFIPCEEMQRTIIDDRFISMGEAVTLYELEGVFKNPLEWVDWEIESASFICWTRSKSERAFGRRSPVTRSPELREKGGRASTGSDRGDPGHQKNIE